MNDMTYWQVVMVFDGAEFTSKPMTQEEAEKLGETVIAAKIPDLGAAVMPCKPLKTPPPVKT